MVERTLYVTYAAHAGAQVLIGRNTFKLERNFESGLISFSEVERIEALQLEHLRGERPEVTRVHLTNWIWLAPDPASPTPTERSGTP